MNNPLNPTNQPSNYQAVDARYARDPDLDQHRPSPVPAPTDPAAAAGMYARMSVGVDVYVTD